MPRLHMLPGFKPNSYQSDMLTANNLKRHKEDLLAQENRELKAALAARDEENKALAAENEGMRRTLAAGTSAVKEVDEMEPETPESNAQEPLSENNVQKSGMNKTKSKSKSKSKSRKKPRRYRPGSTPNQHFAETAVYGPGYLPQCASTSSISMSSTATMSDLPGPGRAIGKLYSRAGKILELCIYRLADRCGYGPYAAYERFITAVADIRPFFPFLHFLPNHRLVAFTAIVWDSLLEYAQRGTVHTQKIAVQRMWQIAFSPEMNSSSLVAVDIDIHKRCKALCILQHLSSLEATRSQCIGDIIEVRCLSENIRRKIILERGAGVALWRINSDLADAIINMAEEYSRKALIIDGSREVEFVWNSVWRKYRRSFRRKIRVFRAYFGYICTGEDHRELWNYWLEQLLGHWNLTTALADFSQLSLRLVELYDEIPNKRSRTEHGGHAYPVEQGFATDVNRTSSTNS